jgi:hypothetical protein
MRNIMMRLLILLWLFIIPGQAWAGAWTANGFIYKPALGARGASEKNTYDAGQDRLDARLGKQIFLGDPNYGSTLSAAIAAIGSSHVTLIVPSGTWVGDNLTVPANVALKVLSGASITVSNATTLTISGPVQAGLYQIFPCSGTGKVVFGARAVKEIYPEWWGAVGDDISDDSAAIKAAITALPNGGKVIFSHKYKVNTGLIALCSNIELKGLPGNLIDISGLGAYPNSRLFTATGAIGTLYGNNAEANITSNVAVGDITINLSSTVGFAVGDYVQLTSEAVLTPESNGLTGEFGRIVSLVANTSITLATSTIYAYNTTDSPKIRKATFIENLIFDGLNIVGPDDSYDDTEALYLISVKNLTVKNCYFRYCNVNAISCYNCLDVDVNNCQFEDALNNGEGYGLGFYSSCQNVCINNIRSRNLHHTVTGGVSSGWYGGPSGVTITNLVAEEARDAAIDCHPGFNAWDISNCKVFGNSSATNFKGINLRGGNGIVSNCIIRNLGPGPCIGIAVTHTSHNRCSWIIQGNYLSDIFGGGGSTTGISMDLTDATFTNIGPISINGNRIDGTFRGIQVQGAAARPINNLDILNNNLTDISQYGIIVYNGAYKGVRINNNKIGGLDPIVTGSIAIYVTNGEIDLVDILNNHAFNWDIGPAVAGSSGTHITNVQFKGNTVYNCNMAKKFVYVDQFSCDDEEINKITNYGYYIGNCSKWRINNNFFKENYNSIYLAGTNSDLKITHNDFLNCTGYGMYNSGTITGSRLIDKNRFLGSLPSVLIDSSMAPIPALADSATPSIAGGGDIWLTGGTTTISNITGGQIGQKITILSEHNISITDGTNILLSGSTDFAMKSGDSLTLIKKADGKWYEVSRSVN